MRKNGFTLVELIIVVAVIGILAAILLPVFTNVVNKANEKSALSDARNIVEEYILEDQIRDEANRARLPENICILVYKGNRFYAYGYNTKVGGSIQVSAANPMEADDFVDCIDKYSWNNSDAHRGTPYDPTVDQDVLDSYTIEHDGAFYLVPYQDANHSYNPLVRGISVRDAEYPTYEEEQYRLINDDEANEMDFNYGEQTGIFHGCLVGAGVPTDNTPEPTTTYTVTYEKGDIPEAVTGLPESETTTGTYTVRPGITSAVQDSEYTFAGWFYKNTDNQASGVITVDHDITLVAHWTTPTHYTVTVNKNGATFSPTPDGFTEDGDAYTQTMAKNSNLATVISSFNSVMTAPGGKTLQYWSVTMNSVTTDYTMGSLSAPIALTKAATITPIFDTTTYTVSFNTDGGTPATIADVTVTHGGTLTFPTPQPTKTNFNFLGWKRTDISTDSNAYIGATYPNGVTSDMAFTAQWGSYTVTFHQSNGDPITTTHNGNVYAVPQVGSGTGYVNVPSGYEFDGWTVAPSGAPACPIDATSYTADRNNIEITAKLKKTQWNVTFWNSYDDTEYTSLAMTVDDGDSLDTLPSAPAAPAAGYTFARWSDQKNGTTPFSDSDAIEADTQIWAVWNAPSARNVTVKFHDDWNDQDVATFTYNTAGATITDTEVDSHSPTYWCFYDDSTTVTIDGSNNAVFHGSLFATTSAGASTLNPTYSEYTGSGAMYQCVTTSTGLYNIGANAETLTGNYLLLNDITDNSSYIDPICYGSSNTFSGIFDGHGYKIGSLGITLQYTSSYGGLFGRNSGTIKNLKVGVHCVMADSYVGALCGDNSGSILNCHVRMGDNSDSWVQAANTRSSSGSQVAICGGFVGKNTGTIQLCSSYLDEVLSGADYTGGFVGQCYGGTIDQCWSIAAVNVTNLNQYTGGEFQSYGRYSGGFVGAVQNSTISNCWVNIGSVTGYQYVGGFAGRTTSSGYIQSCWSCSSVVFQSGSSDMSAIHFGTGSQSTNATNCYYLATNAYYGDNNGYGNVYGASIGSRTGWTSLSVSQFQSGSALTGLNTPIWTYTAGVAPALTNNPRSDS